MLTKDVRQNTVRTDTPTCILRISVILSLSLFMILFSCKKTSHPDKTVAERESLRQVLFIQSLYNNHPGEDIVPEIQEVIDSMRQLGRNPYYYAAVNILIDHLFSNGRFAEADSLAVRMKDEAMIEGDSVSMAMAKRVRAQIFYKLSQPSRALEELQPAGEYITNPYCANYAFSTASSIQEWLWIINREIGDTVNMNRAGLRYAKLVDEDRKINNRIDPTGHYTVTALAFKAQNSFSKGDIQETKIFLDSAESNILPTFPARAYEHLYTVRCKVRAADSDWDGAIEDVDTLLSTHKEFPWFYNKDLFLKAEVLNMSGRHKESVKAYSDYIDFHDSLSNNLTSSRLNDLTLLYRTEIDQEQKRADRLRMIAFISVICLLLVLLILVLLHAAREKKRIRLLVERLKEFDRATETVFQTGQEESNEDISLIERLDRYMFVQRPYTNPALTRKDLAEYAGVPQEAVGQLIKNEKGMTVRIYINSFRLEEARRILESQPEEAITEIAIKLGFGTVRTFQRAFKERYDMSPSQYREASKEINSYKSMT